MCEPGKLATSENICFLKKIASDELLNYYIRLSEPTSRKNNLQLQVSNATVWQPHVDLHQLLSGVRRKQVIRLVHYLLRKVHRSPARSAHKRQHRGTKRYSSRGGNQTGDKHRPQLSSRTPNGQHETDICCTTVDTTLWVRGTPQTPRKTTPAICATAHRPAPNIRAGANSSTKDPRGTHAGPKTRAQVLPGEQWPASSKPNTSFILSPAASRQSCREDPSP